MSCFRLDQQFPVQLLSDTRIILIFLKLHLIWYKVFITCSSCCNILSYHHIVINIAIFHLAHVLITVKGSISLDFVGANMVQITNVSCKQSTWSFQQSSGISIISSSYSNSFPMFFSLCKFVTVASSSVSNSGITLQQVQNAVFDNVIIEGTSGIPAMEVFPSSGKIFPIICDFIWLLF
jgi:hypothetical protein